MNFKNHEDLVIRSLIDLPNSKILDVGCGLGRYLIPLSEQGNQVYGIDKNANTVNFLNKKGFLNVYIVDEADAHLPADFDFVIMSHIIEHLLPKDLIAFLDKYLDYLKVGGKLIIASPFLHKRFYNDYDHIKPYTPNAISLLFSNYEQLQEKPKHRLKMESVWIRRDPFEIDLYPNMSSNKKKIIKRLNKLLINIYRFSKKKLSEKTGWVGLFILTK